MKVVLMAGGNGTRIRSVASDIPKPMIKIDGIPVLEREIICLREQGFRDFIITISYLGTMIKDYFGDGSKWGVNIEYFYEKVPLGNAGALLKIKDRLTETFLLLVADVAFDIDLNKFVKAHQKSGAEVTLFTHPNSHPYDSGIVIADEAGRVLQWLNKEDIRPAYYKNRVNAGLHIINKNVLDDFVFQSGLVDSIDQKTGQVLKIDLDRQVLKPLCGTGKMYCYDSPEYVKDMGTPERFKQVEADYVLGRVSKRNLKNKQKAVFLDRDGTINQYVGFLRNIDDFQLIDGVWEAIRKINEAGYLAIVITNQPVVARGEVTFEELNEIHNKMETLLGEHGAYLDGIYFCPHHPDSGYDGEIKELKIECNCRKPKPGLLLRASQDFNIDLSESYMVGDSSRDIMAGNAAGCKSILISESNEAMGGNAYDIVHSVTDFVSKYINLSGREDEPLRMD